MNFAFQRFKMAVFTCHFSLQTNRYGRKQLLNL